eukprot:CAMPEP_0119424040 /NCGR_PEP_ID=MMETSP1335-20130426/31700_1 /TAXON_ID=259385 /ORGANISM="Chrysoculter rhomboideus, Strain RCC1486" /LENGTH=40 /DNA_ID= /DNA_START= /DNA_END= /DNA_ORIENTATION=
MIVPGHGQGIIAKHGLTPASVLSHHVRLSTPLTAMPTART